MRRWINLDFSAGRAHVQVDNGLAKGASQSFTESESISETSAFPLQNEQIAKYWKKNKPNFLWGCNSNTNINGCINSVQWNVINLHVLHLIDCRYN